MHILILGKLIVESSAGKLLTCLVGFVINAGMIRDRLEKSSLKLRLPRLWIQMGSDLCFSGDKQRVERITMNALNEVFYGVADSYRLNRITRRNI